MLVYSKVLNKLTETEYNQLKPFITGETICPRGLIIDETKLDNKNLLEKIKELKKK